MTEKRPAFYQEQVKMPKASIGLNCFFFECSDSPETGVFPLHWHDHLEMSGRSVSVVLRYGVEADGSFTVRSIG